VPEQQARDEHARQQEHEDRVWQVIAVGAGSRRAEVDDLVGGRHDHAVADGVRVLAVGFLDDRPEFGEMAIDFRARPG
jgi:hypothetical protein